MCRISIVSLLQKGIPLMFPENQK